MSGGICPYLVILIGLVVSGEQQQQQQQQQLLPHPHLQQLPSSSSSSSSPSSSSSSSSPHHPHHLPTTVQEDNTYHHPRRKTLEAESAAAEVDIAHQEKPRKKLLIKDDPQVLRTVEAGLLKMFGLRSRPRPAASIPIPDYMLDLYHKHVEDPDYIASTFTVPGSSLHSANTIRSFTHSDAVPQGGGHHKVTFWFNVSSVPEHETLTAAELRLLKEEHLSNKTRIDIYEIVRPSSSRREAITRLIDTRVVTPGTSKWEVFDVHPAVLKWRQEPHVNHGLEVHVLDVHRQPSPAAKHVRLRRSVGMDDRTWVAKQPLLVTYSDDGRSSKRTRRNSSKKHKKRSRSRYKKQQRKDECRRHHLYVDFSDVGWDDWIVAPPGYEAYYCHGECRFPLPEHFNATNHAIVQSLVHNVNPRAVPTPCCVPTELSAISMLYVDEYEKVVLKNYQDMVVEGCGCR